jgi:S-DNA-T family DNA segregation ATPase FtsK/SpoIIIE
VTVSRSILTGGLGIGRLALRVPGPLLAYVGALGPLLYPLVVLPAVVYFTAGMIGVPIPASIIALGIIVVVLVSYADTGHGFALDHLVDELRRRSLECRYRLAAVRVRRLWPETCTALGWDQIAQETPRRRSGGPLRGPEVLLRRPELRHVEADRGRLRLVWRPRGDQDPQTWASLVDALRRRLGAHSADFREHPTEAGVIVASFGTEPLPQREDAPAQRDRSEKAILFPESATWTSEGFTLGPKAGGGTARWVPADSPHLLVVGATGGGKGGLIRLIARQALEDGWTLKIVDPKASGDYRWAAERGVPVAHELEDQVEELRRAAGEVRTRCRLLWEHGLDRVGLLPPSVRPCPVLVVVDEAADLLLLRRVPPERGADELRAEAGSLVSVIASQGRAAGVHLVVAIQRPDIALLGPAGGFLRDNLIGRVALGRLSLEGLDMLFGSGHRERIVALNGTPGRALAAHLGAGEVEPYGVQVAWLSTNQLMPEGWEPALHGGDPQPPGNGSGADGGGARSTPSAPSDAPRPAEATVEGCSRSAQGRQSPQEGRGGDVVDVATPAADDAVPTGARR